jgi:hypothetical protein
MWTRQFLFHSPMCTNKPLRVMELEVYKANAFPMSLMQWNSHSLKYFVAHVNGHCERTCVNTKLSSFSHAQTFFKRISFIIVEHGMCCNPSLGLATEAKAYKGAGQEGIPESHLMLLGVQESVREWSFTLPKELSFWELESRWTPKSS